MRSRARRGLLAAALLATASAAGAELFRDGFERSDAGLNPRLLDLAPNVWHPLHVRDERPDPLFANGLRQPHGGLIYDAARGTLLLFGSDTHNVDWNNTILEFDPVAERWQRHYPQAAPDTYRADGDGNAVAGDDPAAPLPWAMHAFDLLVHDPKHDRLLVLSRPLHNPKLGAPGLRGRVNVALIWSYRLATRRWQPLAIDGEVPSLFPGSSAYDADRDTVIGYFQGVWELGPARGRWVRVAGSRHGYHHMSVYDAKHKKMLVFGNNVESEPRYAVGNSVWAFTPNAVPGGEGSWQNYRPGGADVPADEHFPVAYDPRHGVTLLVVDHNDAGGAPVESRSYLYDFAANRYRRLPDAGFDFAQRMNYLMAYDRRHGVFLLVTSKYSPPQPLTVWALRLEPARL